MRISVDKTDSGYANWRDELKGRLHVFVDGVKVGKVITADDDEGVVIRFKDGPHAGLLLNAEQEDFEREELRGRVEIRMEH